jgi:AAA ATPase domain
MNGLLGHWLRGRRALKRRFNPYIAGTPVFDGHMFFGRQELTGRLLTLLRDRSVKLTGERRIGKTSFLHHLLGRLAADEQGGRRFFPVFVDLEAPSAQGLFCTLIAEIVETLALSPSTLAALCFLREESGYGADAFRQDLRSIVAELRSRTQKPATLALLIDEVDVVEHGWAPLHESLHDLLTETSPRDLVAVTAGIPAPRHSPAAVARTNGCLHELELTPLTREEAEALVEAPVAGVFRYEADATERILDVSGLRPYLVQKLCSRAVNRMLEEGRTCIQLADVDRAD